MSSRTGTLGWYPPAIGRALSVDVNRCVNSEQTAPDFVREVPADDNPTVVALKATNGETFRAMWKLLSGKRNRSLQLISLVIKTSAAK